MVRARLAAAMLVALLAATTSRASATAIVPPEPKPAQAPAATILPPEPKPARDAARAPAAATESLSDGDRGLYRRAFKHSDRARWTAAFELADKAENRLLAKVLRWRYLTRTGNHAEFDEISRFIDENPDWPFQTFLRRSAEDALARDGTARTALDWLARHPPISGTGQLALVMALAETGAADRAATLAREVWIGADLTHAEERTLLQRFGKSLSAADHWARLDRLLWDGRDREARRMLPRVGPGERRLAVARLRLARQHGGVDAAVDSVPQALKHDPGLIYERVRWRRRKGFIDRAFELLDRPPDDLVRPAEWWVEREIVARRLILEARYAEAFRIASDHRLWPGSAEFASAEWLAGWLALRYLDRPAEALLRFERLHASVQFPISRARAAYWAGRATSALGDHDAAKEWYASAARYDATFYGQLAQRHLGAEPARREPAEILPDDARRAAFERHELVRATKLLDQIGRDEIVTLFFRRLARIDPSPHWLKLTVEHAERLGRTDLAVRVARYAYLEGIELPEAAHPEVDLPDTGIEKALMLAIGRQESNFAVDAVSAAGARGMMQLMPFTARAVARKLRIRYSHSRLTRDGDYNVRLAMAHLADLRARYGDNDPLALAAYNAGRRALDRWVRSIGDPRDDGVDPIDWIEKIPFSETRNYIHRVLENLLVYRRNLGTEVAASWLVAETARAASYVAAAGGGGAPDGEAPAPAEPVQSAAEPPAAAEPAY